MFQSNHFYNISTIVFFLALAGIIFGVFYVFKTYIIPAIDSTKKSKRLKLLLLRMQVLVWAVFGVVLVTRLLIESFFISVAVLIGIALVMRNFLTDFFPGLRLRLSNSVQLNDPIYFKNYSGRIVAKGITTLKIKTEDEELVFIPYRQIHDNIFVKRQTKGKLVSDKLQFEINDITISEAETYFEAWIHQCPWAIPQKNLNITQIDNKTWQITAYAVDKSSLSKIRSYLTNRVKELNESN